MGKVLKLLLVLIFLIALALGGAAFYLSKNINQIVIDTVETYGPQATGTAVSLAGVDVQLLNGRVGLNELVVANPPGYTTAHAIRLDNLVFHVDLNSVLGDVVTIEEFTITGANIIAEQTGTSTNTNLQAIANNAKRGQGKSSAPAPQQEESAAPQREIKLVVNQLNFVGNSVDLVSEQLGDRTITIPDLQLADLGKAEGGLTPEQLGQQVMAIISQQASDAVQKEIEVALKQELEKKAKEKVSSKLSEKFKGLFKKD